MATIAYPTDSAVTTLPSGVTYGYVYIPSKASKLTILFLHGFPSSSYDWRHQISHFSSLGYGVIAPDLLGYSLTSKPSSPADYRCKKMASEIAELLDHLKIDKVHAVAHDWGCGLLARLANYHPDRLLSTAFLDVGYYPPGRAMDIDATNAYMKSVLGYEVFGYWKFFFREDAGGIVKDHAESFVSLTYTGEGAVWKEHLAPLGSVESFIKSDKIAPKADWVSDAEIAMHRRILGDDYGAAMNWYRCAIKGLNAADEENLDGKLKMPVLFIRATEDPLNDATAVSTMTDLCSDLKVVEIKAEHWVQLEKAKETNAALEEFFEGLGGEV